MHILDKLLHYKIYALVRLPHELLNKCCLSLVVGQICTELGISEINDNWPSKHSSKQGSCVSVGQVQVCTVNIPFVSLL